MDLLEEIKRIENQLERIEGQLNFIKNLSMLEREEMVIKIEVSPSDPPEYYVLLGRDFSLGEN